MAIRAPTAGRRSFSRRTCSGVSENRTVSEAEKNAEKRKRTNSAEMESAMNNAPARHSSVSVSTVIFVR